jgi:kynureninase
MRASADPAPTRRFDAGEAWAVARDAADPLRGFRERFHLPRSARGEPLIYFAGNSLGLAPRDAARAVAHELDAWARLAVEAHFAGSAPWVAVHETVRESLARLVGALPGEVVAMNGLTVNLHLLMASFYRPSPARHRVLVEEHAFPSDRYAVASQIAWHGHDPRHGLLVARSRPGETTLRTEELLACLDEHASEIALLLVGAVNYYTGQAFDLAAIARAARAHGITVGFDLAHAAGNVSLALHEQDVDFAVWCSYKYLNAGPGAVAGAFVHERHARRSDLPRLAGWWGHDPRTRFAMHRDEPFRAVASADGWQLSNPPVLALAPLRASLDLFDEAGTAALRAKSIELTGYLERWIDHAAGGRIEILTPRDPQARGCQLSLRAHERPREVFAALRERGVVADFREPDVVRVAPVPLYNSFHDVWRFGRALVEALPS